MVTVDYTASDIRVSLVNNELERMWEETVVVWFELPTRKFYEMTFETGTSQIKSNSVNPLYRDGQ